MDMEIKKILIAVDGSENSTRAVSYVGSVAGNCPGFLIKLLYIERLPDRDFFANEETWLEEGKKQKRIMQEFLHKSQELLISESPAKSRNSQITACGDRRTANNFR